LEVFWLQQFLNDTGYVLTSSGPGSAGQETSFYGPITQAALKQFQCDKSVVCSGTPESTGYGLVGPKTRSALNIAVAVVGFAPSDAPVPGTLPPTPLPPTPPPLPPSLPYGGDVISFTGSFTRSMQSGDSGSAVKKLQEVLNKNGYEIASIGPGSIGNETSFYGSLTQLAVQALQCARDIVCSGTADSTGYGVVGPKTRVELNIRKRALLQI
jgi:peptidoglycan hydrolase-like protein with peptidoglycan-binding domain